MGEHASGRSTSVAVCIASHRRPEGLSALLHSLDALAFASVPRPELFVVVADNDPGESARPVCDDARTWLRHPLVYVAEPRAGVAHARNASLLPALERAEWIAFVDDDEVVPPHWLDALLATQRATDADAVTGPVLPRFDALPPAWVEAGGFFAYPRHCDGTSLPDAYVGNTLVCSGALADLGALFDPAMITGEDTELFARFTRAGHTIVWSDAAEVFERVPPERMRLAYLLRRGMREGIAQARIERRLDTGSRIGGAARGVGRMLQGLAQALAPMRTGTAVRARGLRRAAFGWGRVRGACEAAAPRPECRQ